MIVTGNIFCLWYLETSWFIYTRYIAVHKYYETNKRKRVLSTQHFIDSPIKSMSQLSIYQEVSKKLKNSMEETMSMNDNDSHQSNQINYTFYKPSKYLKMSRKLLLHLLHLQINYSLKKKKEKSSILSRLATVDQQFVLIKFFIYIKLISI
jgi:hypothetical protein